MNQDDPLSNRELTCPCGILISSIFSKNRVWVEIRNVSELMQCDDDLHSDIYVYMENKRWQYEVFEMIKTQSSLSFFSLMGS